MPEPPARILSANVPCKHNNTSVTQLINNHNTFLGWSYLSEASIGMDTSKKEMVWYGIGTNETVWYFNGTANSTSLHYYYINFVVNSHLRILDNP